MITQSIIFTAGQTVKFYELGNFLRVLNASANLTIRTYKNGAILTEAVAVSAGYAEQFDEPYQAIEIYTATAQTVQIASRLGSQVYYDQAPNGNVNITNTSGAFIQSRVSLTNVNQQVLAANTTRRYLMLQNNDASAIMRVTLDGTAATATSGFRIAAGGALDLSGFNTTSAINAMMETATATAGNVEFAAG